MISNAERIKTYRDQNKMSLRTMAVRLGVSEAYLKDLEAGGDVSRNFALMAGNKLELDLHVHKWTCACGATH